MSKRKKTQVRAADSCVFCGRVGPLTKEHVWPRWIRESIPELAHEGREVMGVVGKPHTWTDRRRKPFTRRPKIVCAACNNGWMGTLEERAQIVLAPLIRGEAAELDGACQSLLALWVTKTAMTLRWVHRDPKFPGIPTAHYREVHSRQRPPNTAQVWIAVCSHDDRPQTVPPFGFRYRMLRLQRFEVTTPVGVTLPVRPAYAVTLSLGNFAAVVFGHTYDLVNPTLSYDGLIGAALHPVWPHQDEMLPWPSGHCLNYAEFDLLVKHLERWQ